MVHSGIKDGMRSLIGLFTLFAIVCVAQEEPHTERVHQVNRVFLCFDQKGLEDTLDLVKNPPWQYIRGIYDYKESKKINRNQCILDFIAAGSSAELIGFYRSNKNTPQKKTSNDKANMSERNSGESYPKESSIFSIYKVTLPNGLAVYAANTIYAPQYWRIRRGHDCGHEDNERFCILPTSCASLDVNATPTYVSKFEASEFKIPEDCNVDKLIF